MKIHLTLIPSLLFSLLGLAQPGSNSSFRNAITTQAQPSIATILNAAGKIDLKTQKNGSYNASGYSISYEDNGSPVFTRNSNTPAAGDENWDPDFAITGTDGTVWCSWADVNDIYVGGTFTKAGGITVNNIAKWDGHVWSAIGNGIGTTTDRVTGIRKAGGILYAALSSGVYKWDGSNWTQIGTIATQLGNNLSVNGMDADASGNIYVTGGFVTMNGITVNGVAKWNGTAWSALGNGIDPGVSVLPISICIQGSNVYIGGGFTSVSGIAVNNIAKWNGSSWSAMGTGSNGLVMCMATNGTDLFAGGSNISNAGGVTVNNIAKWNGSAWSALGNGLDNIVSSLTWTSAGLYAGGYFNNSGSTAVNRIGIWNGTAWSNAGNGLVMEGVYALSRSSTLFFAGGIPNNLNSVPLNMHSCAQWNGTSWVVIGNGTNGFINCIAIDGTNLYVGGAFTEAGGLRVNRIAKWNGSKWDSLGAGFEQGNVNALLVVGNKVYAGGTFLVSAASGINYLAVWNGTSWGPVGTGVSYQVFALAASGNDIYVGGNFAQAGSITVNNIAKFDGTNWSALGSGTNDIVRDIKFASDGTMYVGGNFTIAGGVAASRIAKYAGGTWSAMASGVNNFVTNICINSANEIYICGPFDIVINGNVVNHIAKWNGTQWVGLAGGVTSTGIVYSMASRGTDIFAAGDFVLAGSTAAKNIAKWDGTNWTTLGSGMDKDPAGLAITTAMAVNCSNLYAAGYFAYAGDKRADHFARYMIDGAPQASILASATTICAGSSVSFTSTAINPGSAPVYQWQVNGANAGTNSSSYTTSTLTNNAQVNLIITGNAGCVNTTRAVSNTVVMTVNPVTTPAVTISGTTTVQQGTPSLITAVPVNGGAGPVYSWQDSTAAHTWQTINGQAASTINYTAAATGDKLRSQLTSNATCSTTPTVLSNAISFTVNFATGLNPVPADHYGIRFFPNPATNILVIDSLAAAQQWQTAQVISMNGTPALPRISITGRNRASISIAQLPAGTYLLMITRRQGPPAYLRFIKLL